MTKPDNAERTAFEEWVNEFRKPPYVGFIKNFPTATERCSDGSYMLEYVEDHWQGWQARAAASEVKPPVDDAKTDTCIVCAQGDCCCNRTALDAA